MKQKSQEITCWLPSDKNWVLETPFILNQIKGVEIPIIGKASDGPRSGGWNSLMIDGEIYKKAF